MIEILDSGGMSTKTVICRGSIIGEICFNPAFKKWSYREVMALWIYFSQPDRNEVRAFVKEPVALLNITYRLKS